jgi:AAA family ATP:ADP antiporter
VTEKRVSEPRANERAPGVIDRVLRVVGDVRAGEGAMALVLASTVFVLLGAYYILKVAREALLLSEYDAETKAYLSAVQAVILIPVVELYGRLSQRVGRTKLVTIATLFFASHLPIFAVLNGAGVSIGRELFVWVGIFNVFVIAQFWAFANDVYTEQEGRRLFAVVGLGSSLGAIVGSYGAGPLGDHLGPTWLLLLPAGLLVLSLLGVRWVTKRTEDRRAAKRAESAEAEKKAAAEDAEAKKGGRAAVALLFSDRYLVLIAAMWLLVNLVSTIGEYVLDRVMQTSMESRGASVEQLEQMIGDFKSDYFFWINTIGFLLQLLVAGRLMKRGGAALAIAVMPVVALLGQGAMALSGAALTAVMVGKIAENSVNYSIHNTGRNALFLVTSKEVKYKVKVLIDSVLQRAGDVLAAAAIGVAAGVLELSPIAFIIINAVVTAIWLVVTIALAREHRKRAEASEAAEPAGD